MNELEKRAKFHKSKQDGLSPFCSLSEDSEKNALGSTKNIKEAKKKKKPFDSINTNAGNVEHNIAMFNKMNSPTEGPSTNPVSGPFGGDVGGEGMAESLTEGNNVSSDLPASIDGFLQDVAQMFGTISYSDIIKHKYTSEEIKQLASLRKKFRLEARYNDDEAEAKMREIADDVAAIVKSVPVAESMEEDIQKKKPVLYVIRDNHGNILSRPTEDDGELWDRVSSMEARGRRGLCVVVYTPDKAKQINESTRKETVDLDYTGMYIDVCTRRGNPTGYYNTSIGGWLPDDDDTCTVKIDYTYTVEKEAVFDVLANLCVEHEFTEEQMEDHDDDWDKFVDTYVNEHFDELMEKYHNQILDYFYEDAHDQAEEENYHSYYEESLKSTHCNEGLDKNENKSIASVKKNLDQDDTFETVVLYKEPYNELFNKSTKNYDSDDDVDGLWV